MAQGTEQIIKALECCSLEEENCKECPCHTKGCVGTLLSNALSLIKEQQAEIERLRELATTKEVEKEIVRKETKADTVKKMQERLKSFFSNDEITRDFEVDAEYINEQIDQIAKEMLEETK